MFQKCINVKGRFENVSSRFKGVLSRLEGVSDVSEEFLRLIQEGFLRRFRVFQEN